MPDPTVELWWILVAGGLTVLILVVAFGASAVLYARRYLATTRALNGQLLLAHEEERALVARELHDDVLQRIALLSSEVDRLTTESGPQMGHVEVWAKGFRADLVDMAEGIRHIAHGMHPSILDDLGLAAALQRLADDFRDHLLVQLTSIAAPKDLGPDAALCLYRVAQEGLRNAIRHAATGSASIRIETTRGGVALEVVDHGRGFRVTDRRAGSGLGLRSLTERARLLQGELTVDSIPGRGTTVRVWLPLNV